MGSIPQLSVLKGLTGWSGRSARSLHELFEQNAAKPEIANQTAVIFPGRDGETTKWSLKELDRESNRLCRALVSRIGQEGLAEGDHPIAVSLPPSDRLLILLLAVWKSRGSYLPLDPCAPQQRLKHILDEARPLLVVTQSDDLNGAYKGVKTVSLERLFKEGASFSSAKVEDSEVFPSYENPVAIILYTSGSTGVPKGVRVLHSAVLNRLSWQWREFPYSEDERVCVFKTALTFVDSVSEIWGPLLHSHPRAVLVLSRETTKDPQSLIALLEQYKIERLVLVPTLLRTILMYLNLSPTTRMLESLRLWVCSGETLTVSLAEEFVKYFNTGRHALCNFYGSTEIMGDVSYHVIRTSADIDYEGKVPIGVPVDNTILYLLDKQLNMVALGETGELFVAGKNLAAGYVNGRDPHRFIDNPHAVDPEYNLLFQTGDFAKVVKGRLLFEGRTDSQVKVRGHRVDLAEIETALLKIKGIQKSIVLSYKPGEIDQAILAFALPEEDVDLTDREIEKRLESHLPSYSLPQVIIVDKFPLLVNGKVDRQYLLKSYETSHCNGKENDLELDLSDIPMDKLDAAECLFRSVSSVIGPSVRGKINSSANFYALGGNSLNSVFLVTQLRDRGFKISITDFITAKSLLEVIDKMVAEDDDKKSEEHISTRLRAEMFNETHKDDVYRMITDSFYEKADLERWIEPAIERSDYVELMDKMWQPLIDKNLSFVVRAESGEVVGTSLNFDVHDEPEVNITSRLLIVFNFLEYLEGPIREKKLPQGKGQVLHSFMMGTDKSLSPAQNVEVIEFMEEENIRLAKSKSFAGIFTTNTNPLTQQLGTDIFKYKVMHDYQVNQYVAPDGTRPFKFAPDHQKSICSWKLI